jgi:hypothetical protein
MLQNGKAGNGKTFTEKLNSSEFRACLTVGRFKV